MDASCERCRATERQDWNAAHLHEYEWGYTAQVRENGGWHGQRKDDERAPLVFRNTETEVIAHAPTAPGITDADLERARRHFRERFPNGYPPDLKSEERS